MKPTIVVRFHGSQITARFFLKGEEVKGPDGILQGTGNGAIEAIRNFLVWNRAHLEDNTADFFIQPSVMEFVLAPAELTGEEKTEEIEERFLDKVSKCASISIELTNESLRW